MELLSSVYPVDKVCNFLPRCTSRSFLPPRLPIFKFKPLLIYQSQLVFRIILFRNASQVRICTKLCRFTSPTLPGIYICTSLCIAFLDTTSLQNVQNFNIFCCISPSCSSASSYRQAHHSSGFARSQSPIAVWKHCPWKHHGPHRLNRIKHVCFSLLDFVWNSGLLCKMHRFSY